MFAAGHTVGFLKFMPPSAEGRSVRDAMINVRFQVGRSNASYGDFYNGFGLFANAYLLFAAFLAWWLGNVARAHPEAIGSLGWGFFILHVASLVLSWIYFLAPPVILSGLIAICAGWAAWLVSARKPQSAIAAWGAVCAGDLDLQHTAERSG